jgi:dienelactone hydrolase
MCEYLASHGYVVMTSAFQSADGQHVSNNYNGPETSWSDLAFLLKHAQSLPFVDSSKAGAIGHSMGAQYLLEWLGQQPSPALNAVVSLDTTFEYTPEDYVGHRSLRNRFANLKPVKVPVLLAASADRSPRFATWDRYLTERTDLSIRHFRHGDFLVHGSLARAYNRKLAAEVRSSFDQLVVAVRSFFDTHFTRT